MKLKFCLLIFAVCFATASSAQQFVPKNKKFGSAEATAVVARCAASLLDYSAESGGKKINFKAQYSGSAPVFIRWINHDGELDARPGSTYKIGTNGQFEQRSFAGHYFLISRDREGRSCLGIIDAREFRNLKSFGF